MCASVVGVFAGSSAVGLMAVCLLCGSLFSCSGSSSDPGTPVSQKLEVTIQVVNEQGAAVPNAYVYVQRVANNVIRREEDGYTTENGRCVTPVTKASTQAMVTVYCSGYEPSQVIYSHTSGKKTVVVTMHPKTNWSIISYNILYGLTEHNYNNMNKNRFVAWIQKYDPDLVFLQETNYFNEATLLTFAQQWGHTYAIMNKSSGFPCSLTSKFPFTEVKRVGGAFYTTSALNDPQTPTYPYFHHGYLRAKWNGIYLYCIHLDPFHYEDRKWEIDSLIRDMATLPSGAQIMIAGDHNSENYWDEVTIGSTVFRSEFYRYRSYYPNYDVTNAILTAGLKDTYTEKNPYFKASTGHDSTYLTTTRNRWRIDYAFVTPGLASRITFSDIIKDYYTDRISDHYPVHIRLRKQD